jgi:hypothetical protein
MNTKPVAFPEEVEYTGTYQVASFQLSEGSHQKMGVSFLPAKELQPHIREPHPEKSHFWELQ